MKKIPDSAFEDIAEDLAQIESFLQEAHAAVEKAECIREHLWSRLDELATKAEDYADSKSEKWRESDAGTDYVAWAERLREIADMFGEPFEFERPSALDEITEASDVPASPSDI